MKFKKVILVTLAATGLFIAGCSTNTKPDTKEILQKTATQKLDNGYMKISSTLKYEGETFKTTSEGAFSSDPMISQTNVTSKMGDESQTVKQWMDSDNIYMKLAGSWFKAPVKDVVGYDAKAWKKNLEKNKNSFIRPTKNIVKDMKVTEKGNDYVLTLNANKKNKNTLKEITQSMLKMMDTTGSTAPTGQAKELLKQAKFKKCSIKEVVDKKTNKVKSTYASMKIEVGDLEMNITEKIDKVGKYSNLKIPSDIKKAKALPKEVLKQLQQPRSEAEDE